LHFLEAFGHSMSKPSMQANARSFKDIGFIYSWRQYTDHQNNKHTAAPKRSLGKTDFQNEMVESRTKMGNTLFQ